ncbi:TRAP transporter small permease [Fredinandcohnia onubensis]|uniref:TRAP transporter small permease n=1 Tax=Fredinandcohnia onubensis TaxID=1571209 RepID=UPI002481C9B6|nr:TRAP transporter small permease [Fredinandcohnia onubensis]
MSLFLLLGVGVSLYGVFMRYFLKNPSSWATEVYSLLILVSIFIGLGVALRNNEHIAIDLVYDRMNNRWKKISDYFSLIIGVIFSVFFLVTGSQLLFESFKQGIVSISTGLPIWVTYLVIPISGLLLLIHYVVKIISYYKVNKF